MHPPAPDVLCDPVGVVADLILQIEPDLDRESITGLIERVAAGRVKRRRLAQSLLDKPALLTDGRSPAPRVVGDLLIALRQAGTTRISPPICTDCGKTLRTLQRRGQDWYCGVCGPQPQPCAACGHTRAVNSRDRAGQARCAGCPPGDDPVAILIEVVAGIDPTIPAEAVAAAVHTAASQTGRRYQLAWAVQDRPELLTGAGAHATMPSVLRLIDALRDLGAQGILRPPCPHCERVIALVKRRDGVWLCRNCVAKSRAQTCAGCGVLREPASRDEHGGPLCAHCLVKNPANHETCAGCGQRRPVNVRTPDGPLCSTCRPWQTLECSICGRTAECVISKTTGDPWCRACKQRWVRCTGCAEVGPVRGGTRAKPLCAHCVRPDAAFWRCCTECGQSGRINAGRCARCAVAARVHDLLSDEHGAIRPELEALYKALTATARPATIAAWLERSAAPQILRDLQTGAAPIAHQTLDELPAGKTVEHLRSVLVAIGTLPARDEQITRLERWITHAIGECQDPDERQVLHRYAVWHLLRRLRQRNNGAHATHTQITVVQQQITAAISLLDWLTTHQLTLDSARQGDLDTWLTSEDSSHQREAGNFVRWARRQKLTSLDFAATRWDGPTRTIDTQARWDQARRLLHDNTLKPADRVAGLLVLLYAQWPATISRLTLDHVDDTEDEVRLRLGREPILLPAPLAQLVRNLTTSRHGHATLGDQGTSRWLFPGGQPGRPISAYQLAQRLRQLGIRPGQARSTALFHLATELPAALLARLLGIHISVAVAWQRASGGDWTNYAADYSRRKPASTKPVITSRETPA
jgi:hypothetical protein